MELPAIHVEHLSKRYILGQFESYKTIREAITNVFSKPFIETRTPKAKYINSSSNYFWALRDISFDVSPGEVVGIIGPNGSGKSTLLKLLSRITIPTEGYARLQGRLGSLLEVGTGFHPELTGHENIFLSGSIQGMRKSEIEGKYDSIVKFAEIGEFLETPVKRYSSGMYVRLAFAVAAHLDLEIMLVDEVLAVGDANFQKKCLGKMHDVAKEEGRTVLLVSHNMAAIRRLCTSGIYLKEGRLRAGKLPIKDAIDLYSADNGLCETELSFPIQAKDIIIYAFEVNQDGKQVIDIDGSYPFNICLEFAVLRDLTLFRIGIYIETLSGDTILRSFIADWDSTKENIARGNFAARLEVPGSFLVAGNYRIRLHASRLGIEDYLHKFNIQYKICLSSPLGFNEAHMSEPIGAYVISNKKWELIKR